MAKNIMQKWYVIENKNTPKYLIKNEDVLLVIQTLCDIRECPEELRKI